MDKRGLITVNVLSALMFAAVVGVYIVLPDTMTIAAMGVMWVGYTVVANSVVLFRSFNKRSRLESYNKYGYFDDLVSTVNRQISSMESRKEVFDEIGDSDRVKEVYNIARGQFETNVEYIMKYMQAFDYVTKPRSQTERLSKLLAQNHELILKVNNLVEQLIEVDRVTENIDTTVLDDMIESMRSMAGE